ncbi:hypothetical protein DQM28_02755 [Leptospira mayottensis]|nr:hypothetical protein DQM28_02755 [Leptospira mayottensis]
MAINFPAYGQQRSSNKLKIIVASATVRSVWVDLETFSKRLRQNGAPSGLENRGFDASIYHKTRKPTEGT